METETETEAETEAAPPSNASSALTLFILVLYIYDVSAADRTVLYIAAVCRGQQAQPARVITSSTPYGTVPISPSRGFWLHHLLTSSLSYLAIISSGAPLPSAGSEFPGRVGPG